MTLLTKEMTVPNGIAFSPDEKTLYVANSDPEGVWMAFPVKADGTLGEARSSSMGRPHSRAARNRGRHEGGRDGQHLRSRPRRRWTFSCA